MCDPTPVRNWILQISAAIIGVLALTVAAAVAKGSWWTAWASPILIGLAGGAALGAAAMCGGAVSALNTFCTCAAKSPACAGPCSSLRNIFAGAAIVLGIQGLACLLAAFTSAGSDITMWIVTAALALEAALLVSAAIFYAQLSSCQSVVSPPAPPTTPTGPANSPGPIA
jgi:hypothetical protein